MNRPYDWAPLASGDPVPGDPELVERAGADYQLIARAIDTAAARLRAIAADVEMQSDAVVEVRRRALEVADRISGAQQRYEALGTALMRYAPLLTEAQQLSLRAFRLAQDAVHDQRLALTAAADAEARIAAAPAGSPAAAADLADARRRESTAVQGLADARTLLDRAIQTRDDAAEAARRIIDAAKSQDGLNDSRWDNVKGAVVSTLKSLAHIADAIAVGAGVLALVFAAVPFVGPFFAAVALVASIASLALKLTLMAFGEGNWLDIGLTALGVATFGVGKVALSSSAFAATSARAYARLAAGRSAAQAPAVRAAAGLPSFSSSARTIDTLMGAGNGMSRAAARSAAELAAHRGPGATLGRALESARQIPAGVVDDLKNVRQFDLRTAGSQIRSNTPLHPLSFLGEPAAAADAQAIGRLHVALRAEPLVAEQVRAQVIASGAFVSTWAAGNLLLGRDTLALVSEEPGPFEKLHLTGAAPTKVGGTP